MREFVEVEKDARDGFIVTLVSSGTDDCNQFVLREEHRKVHVKTDHEMAVAMEWLLKRRGYPTFPELLNQRPSFASILEEEITSLKAQLASTQKQLADSRAYASTLVQRLEEEGKL